MFAMSFTFAEPVSAFFIKKKKAFSFKETMFQTQIPQIGTSFQQTSHKEHPAYYNLMNIHIADRSLQF
jgi:hypothetical protein